MSIIKDFLLQLLLVAIPIFGFQTFIKERLKSDKRENFVFSILWGMSIILCMSFPAAYGPGYHLDIRIIPLLLGTLYCGIRTGILLSVVVILLTLYFRVDTAFYNTVLALISSLPVIFLSQISFKKSGKYKRIRIAVLLSFYYDIFGIFWFTMLRNTSPDLVYIQAIHLIFVVTCTWFFTYLIENIREMNQLRSDIHNSEKIRVISELTSVFAHEIRNPLQVSRGFLQLLNEPDLPDKKKEYIQLSIEELDRANEIIKDLLFFGKPSVNDNQTIDVANELRHLINIVQSFSMLQNVSIKTSINNDCWIHANPQKLNQCLVNILKNAIESMPNGGTICVSCAPTNDGYIEINIKDQGVGMTKEQIDKLGSPFYSLKKNGTGLGMMVSFQLIRSLDGKVHVSSEIDVGTRFSILLPKAR